MLRFSRALSVIKAFSLARPGKNALFGSARGVSTYNSLVGGARVEEGRESSRLPRYIFLALLGSASAATEIFDSAPDTYAIYTYCDVAKEPIKKKLTKEELIQELKEKLTKCRDLLNKDNKVKIKYPNLYVKSIDDSTHQVILYSKWPYLGNKIVSDFTKLSSFSLSNIFFFQRRGQLHFLDEAMVKYNK